MAGILDSLSHILPPRLGPFGTLLASYLTRKMQSTAASAEFVVGAEESDVINVGIQLYDADGRPIAEVVGVTLALFADAGGLAFNTETYDAVAIGTDGALAEVVAGKLYYATSEADGHIDIDFTLDDTDEGTSYLALMDPNGKILSVSDAITHANQTT